jgi:hypothetical protein
MRPGLNDICQVASERKFPAIFHIPTRSSAALVSCGGLYRDNHHSRGLDQQSVASIAAVYR